jgi:steroid 5-alpha reductase family enzyme
MIVLVGLGLSAIMSGAWVVQRVTSNAGWVDVTWSFGTGAAAILLALTPIADAPVPGFQQILVAVLIAIWSVRLVFHLFHRVWTSAAEDARYADFRSQWGDRFQRRLWRFLQIQALAGFILALVAFAAARNHGHGTALFDLIGCTLFAAALAGETEADRQLRRFRADPANRDGICRNGLWAWSRHPNFFFEWLGWCSYPLIAFDPSLHSAWWVVALAGPVMMYWLLVHVSGLPPIERLMLRSRGEAYQVYQATTSAFVPLPPGLVSLLRRV